MLTLPNTPGQMTHMPFLAPSRNGQTVLFFCQSGDDHIWKLHYLGEDGQPVRLHTGLGDDVIECAPTAWQDASGWHVSFIAGGAKDNPRYHLYRMDGPSLASLSQPVPMQNARTGFVHRDRIAWGERQDLIHVREPAGDQDIELPGAYIYRVSYRPDEPERLLISGQWIGEEEVFSIEYDLASGEQSEITCDGKPAYKCAMLGERVIFADRIGEHFEARALVEAEKTERRSSKIAQRRRPGAASSLATPCKNCKGKTKEPANPAVTRPSCLECVEKHLGAAYVLLSETRDGYAHRLRAVGHLHEAEDESQEWPQMHAAIRDARRSYQRDAVIPDWEAIGELVEGVRAHAS